MLYYFINYVIFLCIKTDVKHYYLLNIMLETNLQDAAELFTRNKLVVSEKD